MKKKKLRKKIDKKNKRRMHLKVKVIILHNDNICIKTKSFDFSKRQNFHLNSLFWAIYAISPRIKNIIN